MSFAMRAGRVTRAVWNGPFAVGKLTRPVSVGDAVLKFLETIWRGLIAIVALLLLGSGGLAIMEVAKPAPLGESIEASARYNRGVCKEASHPILVEFVNHSSEKVGLIDFKLVVREKNRSSELNSESWESYKADSILPPGYYLKACWSVPEINSDIAPANLTYRPKINYATAFDEDE